VKIRLTLAAAALSVGFTAPSSFAVEPAKKPAFGFSTLKAADVGAAKEVGRLVAERAVKAGVKQVVFDRGGYIFHGRIKALADAAREAGLDF